MREVYTAKEVAKKFGLHYEDFLVYLKFIGLKKVGHDYRLTKNDIEKIWEYIKSSPF